MNLNPLKKQDVWCPQTDQQTWIAVHPETGEEFITGNCTHSGPNLAQIPAGPEFRSLFGAPDGWVLVGADLANIEIRVLAHYLAPYDGGKYAKTVLSKDMHFFHSKLAGFWKGEDVEWDEHTATPEMKSARGQAKAFFFGYLYGQGSTIRGSTLSSGKEIHWYNSDTNTKGVIGESKDIIHLEFTQAEYNQAKERVERRLELINGKEYFPLKKDEYVEYTEDLIIKTIYGEQVANTFLTNLTGIKELIQDCQKQSKEKGTVTAIDGRELYSRSPHSALNLLLQGSAGVIAKQWGINYNKLAQEAGLIYGKNYYQSAYVHDEYQSPCKDEGNNVEILCKAFEEGAALITEQYKCNIPIKGDAQVGRSWADTH